MVPDPWMRFISRVEDYMKYKPVEVLIFENQQFRPVLQQHVRVLFSDGQHEATCQTCHACQAFAYDQEVGKT